MRTSHWAPHWLPPHRPPLPFLLPFLLLPALALALVPGNAEAAGVALATRLQREPGVVGTGGISTAELTNDPMHRLTAVDHGIEVRQRSATTSHAGRAAGITGTAGTTGTAIISGAGDLAGAARSATLGSAVLQRRRLVQGQATDSAVSVHSDSDSHSESQNLNAGEGGGESGSGQGQSVGIPGSRIGRKGLSPQETRRRIACFGAQGQWRWQGQPRRVPWNVQGLEHCDVQWVRQNRYHLAGPRADAVQDAASWNVRETLKYRWRPDPGCGEWMEFRKSWFCAALDNLGGSMLLVGDSVTRNMLHSLHNHMSMGEGGRGRRANLLFKPALCKHWESSGRMEARMKLCSCMTPCAGRHQVCHVRNDWLTLNATHFADVSVGYFVPWRSLVKSWDVKALVLNRGAHFQPNERFIFQLQETVGALRREHPDLLILYRGSTPGHSDCDSYTKPLQEPQAGPLPFHWSDVLRQNAFAKRITEQHGGVYLDVETMTTLRADGHFGSYNGKVDCLHYCSPGPVDEWVRLLYNAMIQLL